MTPRLGRFLVGLPPYAWLALFFLVPFLIVLKISLSEPAAGIPPYMPLWEWGEGAALEIRATRRSFFLPSPRLAGGLRSGGRTGEGSRRRRVRGP